jgi:hypothetical protein
LTVTFTSTHVYVITILHKLLDSFLSAFRSTEKKLGIVKNSIYINNADGYTSFFFFFLFANY